MASTVWRKKRKNEIALFFMGSIICCAFVVLICYIDSILIMHIFPHRCDSTESNNFTTICTDGCRIPFLTIDEDSYQKLLQKEHQKVKKLKPCRTKPLLGSNKSHIWVEKENIPHYNLSRSDMFSCCYRSFSDIDSQITYSDCQTFTDTIEVNSEFVRVTCNNGDRKIFDSFFAFAPQKEIVPKNKDLPYNILILGIDGVSRLNFHRTMPKTSKFLEMFGAVELLGYNKVGDNTYPNLLPLLMGLTEAELDTSYYFPRQLGSFDKCPFIWKSFQQAGFTTAFAEDTFRSGTFNFNKHGFKSPPTDYYLGPFMKEAEFYAGHNFNIHMPLCMNNKFFFKILLDYIEDLTALKSKVFGFFWEASMTYHDLFYPTVMDDSYSGFFDRLNASGYLKESIIFLISDHGIRYGSFRRSKQGFLEERLPFVFALMPPSFRNNFNEAFNNLKLNRHRLTTPFDMHATLTDLVNLENIKNYRILSRSKHFDSSKGTSLFLPISDQRTCRSAGIDDHWCTCYRDMKMKLGDIEAKEAVAHAIAYLNGLFEDNPQCATLTLGRNSLEATRLIRKSFKDGWSKLVVTFQTEPGGGLFEATLSREGSNGWWSVIGSVSRLNLYGNQSHCVSDRRLKLYCYCVDTH